MAVRRSTSSDPAWRCSRGTYGCVNHGWHGVCCSHPQMGLAMVEGVITGKDVLWNAGGIVRSYGLLAYLRCLRALLSGRRTTFLELVWAR